MKPRTCRIISRRRRREGGFALLLVFLMAAIIGITLYMELPRVAFQSQREKEQLLIERGQQYQMAIRRYMQRNMKAGMNQAAAGSWPSKIEDLENTNGRRFLRRRYIDPMTGKDEWRLVHINNGVLTDSVNNKNNQQNDKWGNGPQGITEFAGLGQTLNNQGAQGLNLVNRRRASDSNTPGGENGSGDSADSSNTSPGSSQAGGVPPVQGPQPGMPGFVPGAPGASGPVVGQPFQPGQPGSAFPGNSNANNPSNTNSGFGGMSGSTSSFGSPAPASPASGVQGGYAGSPYPNQGQPGATPNAPPQSVANLLNNMLTQPRPGGMPQTATSGFGSSFSTPPASSNSSGGFGTPAGTPMAVPTAGVGGATMGGGLAGVASTVDADSIMVCGDKTNYHEWEFIFDPTKWKPPSNPNTQLGGTPAGTNGNNTASSMNTGSNTGPGAGFGGAGAGSIGGTGGAGMSGVGGVGGVGQNSPGGQSPTQGQNGQPGQNGQNSQGGFGNVCGMEARPGAR